jgi:hypothetical protein
MDATEAELNLVEQIRSSRERLGDDLLELEHRFRTVADNSRSIVRSVAIGGAVIVALFLFVPRFFRAIRRTYAPFR